MSRYSKIRSLIAVTVLALVTPLLAVAEEAFVEGTHYIKLDQPVRTRDASKVEVVELFWYGCSHCYAFEPLIKQWKKSMPADVDFWQSPAMWNANMKTHAQMFYATEVLGVRDKVHDAIFTAMNVERKRLANVNEIAAFLADYGVDSQEFKKTFKSFSVNSQVNQADARARSYKITGTPEVVVNGKYRVSGSSAGGQAEMLKVVDFLIAKERANLVAK